MDSSIRDARYQEACGMHVHVHVMTRFANIGILSVEDQPCFWQMSIHCL